MRCTCPAPAPAPTSAPALWTGRWATGFSLAFRGPSWIWRRHHKCNINIAGMCPTIIPRLPLRIHGYTHRAHGLTLEHATLRQLACTTPDDATSWSLGHPFRSRHRVTCPSSSQSHLSTGQPSLPYSLPNLVIIPHGTRPRRSANDASNAREHRHKHRTRQKSPPADSLGINSVSFSRPSKKRQGFNLTRLDILKTRLTRWPANPDLVGLLSSSRPMSSPRSFSSLPAPSLA